MTIRCGRSCGPCPIHGFEIEKNLSIVKSYIITSGVAQWLACWAHNPKVRGSKPRSAILIPTSHGSMHIVHNHEQDPHDVDCSTSLMGMKPKAFWVQFQFLSFPPPRGWGEDKFFNFSFSPPTPARPPLRIPPPPPPRPLPYHFSAALATHTLCPWAPRCNILSSHSQVPAGNKHDQDMTSRNRQPNLVGTLPVSTFLFRGWFKPPFRLEACLFIVILAVAWLPNASKIEQTWWWHNRIVFQMQWKSTSHSEWSAAFLFFMNTMCPTHVWLQNGVASSLSLNLPRLQHCNIFLLYRRSFRFQFFSWHAEIAEVQWCTSISIGPAWRIRKSWKIDEKLTLAGLEPAIFGSEDQRLIH